jgi:hypothetical protein
MYTILQSKLPLLLRLSESTTQEPVSPWHLDFKPVVTDKGHDLLAQEFKEWRVFSASR